MKCILKQFIKIACIISFFFAASLFQGNAYASTDYRLDINFNGNLELTDNGVLLFHDENIVPGDYFITDVTVTNHTNFNVDFYIDNILVDNPYFKDIMIYQIVDQDGNIIYERDSNFSQKLKVFSPGEVEIYTLKSTINQKTKNVVQGQSAFFTFIFRVYTDEQETIDVPNTGGLMVSLMTSWQTYATMIILLVAAIVVYAFIRRSSKKHRQRKTKSKKNNKSRNKKKHKATAKKSTQKRTPSRSQPSNKRRKR